MKSRTLGVSVTILAALVLSFSQKANATSTALEEASSYNVFSLGDFNEQNTDVEGKLAAGGNVTFVNNSIGGTLAQNSGNVLVAGGNLTLNSGQVNHGNAVYGGTATITNEGFPNGTASKGNPIDFNTAASDLKSLSTNLASLTPIAPPSVQQYNGGYNAINLTGTDSQLDVFNLDGNFLTNASSFNLNIASKSGSTVVVNISGTNVSLKNGSINISGTTNTDVLFNFYQATTLTDNGVSIEGSVLAPGANFNFNNAHVDGNVIVGSVHGTTSSTAVTGQFNNVLFQGTLPTFPTKPKKVPEPANLTGLGLIAAMLGLSRTKRNNSQAQL